MSPCSTGQSKSKRLKSRVGQYMCPFVVSISKQRIWIWGVGPPNTVWISDSLLINIDNSFHLSEPQFPYFSRGCYENLKNSFVMYSVHVYWAPTVCQMLLVLWSYQGKMTENDAHCLSSSLSSTEHLPYPGFGVYWTKSLPLFDICSR